LKVVGKLLTTPLTLPRLAGRSSPGAGHPSGYWRACWWLPAGRRVVRADRGGAGRVSAPRERERRTFPRRVQGADVPKRPRNRIRGVSDRMGRCGRTSGDHASRTGASLRHAGTLAGTPGAPNRAKLSPGGAQAGTLAGTPGGLSGGVTRQLRVAGGTVRRTLRGRVRCPLGLSVLAGEWSGEGSRGRSVAVNERVSQNGLCRGFVPTYGQVGADRRTSRAAAFSRWEVASREWRYVPIPLISRHRAKGGGERT